ncbi:MAG: pyruvate, water dikinase regulatory protein [Anaerolineales bacterium]|jgi:regulator of PEP synthase PpsR (kinase-PPPase family)
MLTIYAVSDATGETAERVLLSALVQFQGAPARVLRRGDIRTAEQVREVVAEAAGQDSLVLHTLVSDELRHQLLAEARNWGVDCMDLLGPVLDRLATHLRLTPQEKPGLFKQIMAAQSREIEAVEFAFRHDDGQNVEGLTQAELVLVGVSRTMKTPTMLYLAYRGWFAANVPLVLGMDPPAALFSLPAERVFCLVMAPSRLVELRTARAEHLAIPAEPYTSLEAVRAELRDSQEVSQRHGWRIVDVTGKSVEEVTREILALFSQRGNNKENHPGRQLAD